MQLGFKETHWICGIKESRSNMLYELIATDTVLYKQT